MTSLRMSHHIQSGRRIVEIYDNTGTFVAAIYPDNDANGIKIVSSYFDGHSLDEAPPPALTVRFKR